VTRLLTPAPTANVLWLDEVDSTNSLALRLLTALLADEEARFADTMIVAGRQSAGRGRGDRAWQSPLGGLYATWLGWLPAASLALVPQAAGVAIAEAVEACLPGIKVGLKWPNDLQVESRKLGGVLCHARTEGDAAAVVVGFGVNVAVAPELAPGDATVPVALSSLGYGDAAAALWTIVGAFLTRFSVTLADPASTRQAWLGRCVHRRGDRLRIEVGGSVREGRFVAVNESGELELAINGAVHRFSVADTVTAVGDAGG
jgi:BirA family biotin operon repressor/biotin-[acetyl-CoA-carboxylase] ligase